MKPPLPAVPLTEEDDLIWAHLGWGDSLLWRQLAAIRLAERRDAELMSWLSLFGHRHYARLPPLPKAAQLPVVHLWLRIDPEWPAGHHIIELT